MPKKPPNNIVYKDKTKYEMMLLINKEFPVAASKNLVDRVANRYPFISKKEVEEIINLSMEGLRDFLILGFVVDITGYFNNMRLRVTKNFNFIVNSDLSKELENVCKRDRREF